MKKAAKIRRTEQLLAYIDNMKSPSKMEKWDMLKGLLVAPFSLSGKDYERADSIFDGSMIARKMDELNAAAMAALGYSKVDGRWVKEAAE